MEKQRFDSLALSPEILKAVAQLGFEEATPIQSAAIPVLLSGSDLVGQSQTGSGKTAAFAIPAIEKVDPHSKAVQVLILCPTRELAEQVANEVHQLTAFKRSVHSVPIYGGASYDRQLFELKKGVQIVIGTPGRIIDHLERGTLKLDQLKVAILDEADRMLDMGFRDDIQRILDATPQERRMVDELADALLAQGFSADRLHGGITQAQRTRVMGKFKNSEFEFLVATDVAARGIDVEDLEIVINYDLPHDPEDYVHRIGRTGRAGRKGMAATFVSGRDIYKIQYLEKFTHSRIRKGNIPTPGEVEGKRSELMIEKVRDLLQSGKFNDQMQFTDRLMEEGFQATEVCSALFSLLLGQGSGDQGCKGSLAGFPNQLEPNEGFAKPKKFQNENVQSGPSGFKGGLTKGKPAKFGKSSRKDGPRY